MAERFYELIKKGEKLTNAEEHELFCGYRKNPSIERRNAIVLMNEGLVLKISTRYMECGIAMEDLRQEGYIALCHAVDRFDPDKGYKFSTFASKCIMNAMQAYISENRGPVHIPDYIRKAECRWNKRNDNMSKGSFGHRAFPDTPLLLYDPISLNAKCSDDGDEFGDMLPGGTNPADRFEKESFMEDMLQAINALSEEEKALLADIFGLNGHERKKHSEIRVNLGLTYKVQKRMLSSIFNKLKENAAICEWANAS